MVDDIKKKSGDLDHVKGLSRDLQKVLNVSSENMIMLVCHLQLKHSRIAMPFQAHNHRIFKCITFQEYEVKSNTYCGTLHDDEDDDDDDDDDDDEPIPKKRQTSTMAQAVQRKVQL